MGKSIFSKEDIYGFSYALDLNNITPYESHYIMWRLGYNKNQYGRYTKQQKMNAYQRLLTIPEFKDRIRNAIIRNRNKNINNNKITESKNIYITEKQLSELNNKINEGLANKKEFPIEPDKVLLIKKYLDNGFKRGKIETIDDNGYPISIPIVSMLANDNSILKNMTDIQLFYLLQDRFKNIYDDKNKRDKLLKQIIKDWFYNKITKDGLLSVNRM